MTDKEKVLAKFPGAWCIKSRGIFYINGVVDPLIERMPHGSTESEAWANAAKGLE